jgi:hypothetical protein
MSNTAKNFKTKNGNHFLKLVLLIIMWKQRNANENNYKNKQNDNYL